MFLKIGVLKKIANFTGKPKNRCFPAKKFLRTPFFAEYLQLLLLQIYEPPKKFGITSTVNKWPNSNLCKFRNIIGTSFERSV